MVTKKVVAKKAVRRSVTTVLPYESLTDTQLIVMANNVLGEMARRLMMV